MKSKLLVLSCVALMASLTTVAADPPKVILVEDVGATKVVKAELKDVLEHVIVRDAVGIDAIVIVGNLELPSFSEPAVNEPVNVFTGTPDPETPERSCLSLAGSDNPELRPPSSTAKRSTKIFLKNCSIRQC